MNMKENQGYEKPELVKHEQLKEVTLKNSHNNGNATDDSAKSE